MQVLGKDETEMGTVKNTYKIVDGISTVEGAVRILEEMDYPEEMLETVKNIDLENLKDETKHEDSIEL